MTAIQLREGLPLGIVLQKKRLRAIYTSIALEQTTNQGITLYSIEERCSGKVVPQGSKFDRGLFPNIP